MLICPKSPLMYRTGNPYLAAVFTLSCIGATVDSHSKSYFLHIAQLHITTTMDTSASSSTLPSNRWMWIFFSFFFFSPNQD